MDHGRIHTCHEARHETAQMGPVFGRYHMISNTYGCPASVALGCTRVTLVQGDKRALQRRTCSTARTPGTPEASVPPYQKS